MLTASDIDNDDYDNITTTTTTMMIIKIKAKAAAAIGALGQHVPNISINSSLRLFDAKIKPIVTYNLNLISPSLKCNHLTELDRVKNRFLKRVLCLPLSTSNENVHKLCDTYRLCVELHDKNFKFDEQA
ncbi:hypothetical protein DERP_012287 [Dermatophagoides pteronyssinus]|uniref:Uncharacterized protein n=1 Tax=Dermatophagoides pteronyssinus TaxID=6956 RepID=A0ABQ8JQC3_DERPT|nr:hypothetical protein DERP_012287 [Dermatophagoides pteronyssinus]